MESRVTRRTGDRISVLGVGTSGLPAAGAKEGAATLEMALEQGINYFDLATADSACFPIFGAALAGVRRQVLYQVHFGANYAAGKPYSWTTDLETVKRSVAWQLEQLRTDYIDYGFIHCMDESGDWRRYVDNGVLQYLEALKAQAVCARSYAYNNLRSSRHTSYHFDVCNTTDCQVYYGAGPNNTSYQANDRTDRAVEETEGEYARYDGHRGVLLLQPRRSQ